MARWGGEEFPLLLPETQKREASRVAEKIRQVVSNIRLDESADAQPLTVSLGVACIDQAQDLEAMLGQADKALYAA